MGSSVTEIIQSVRLKITRAERHFQEFKDAFSGNKGTIKGLHEWSLHLDSVRQEWSWSADLPEPTPEWGIIVGDAIHQLRAALDNLASQLVFDRLKDKSLWRKTAFPIFKSDTELASSRVVCKFRDALLPLHPDLWDAFVDAQPYKRQSAAPTQWPLWILSELDNIDKHRTIVVVGNVIAAHISSIDPSGQRVPVELREKIRSGQKTGQFAWPVPFPPQETHSEGTINPELFSEFTDTDGLCDGWAVGRTVRDIITTVNCTVSDFERRFV
jgi:hypothetical protein